MMHICVSAFLLDWMREFYHKRAQFTSSATAYTLLLMLIVSYLSGVVNSWEVLLSLLASHR